ncbi:MAG TPA: T9SS type A sorting domain-containing protein, partial [Bacteroidia bacterium]|nr:T9SS type A sorting domain-containing protein [Bacteroidia bacterium]
KDIVIPTYSATFSPASITCTNSSIMFSPTCTSTSSLCSIPITMTWTSPPPTQTTTVTSPSYTVPGTYTLAYTNTQNGCIGITTTVVPSNTNIPIISVTGNTAICVGQTATITASAGTGPYTYSWSTGSNIPSITVSPTITTNYTVTVIDTTSYCGSQNVVTVSYCTGIQTLLNNKDLKIYPNPSNGSFKFFVDREISHSELILYNSRGQKIHEQKIISGENNIITVGLPDGLYYYVLLENKLQLGNGKLVIEQQ